MPTNFELERLKPKLDIFKIPENRVHELTDSNVSRNMLTNFERKRLKPMLDIHIIEIPENRA